MLTLISNGVWLWMSVSHIYYVTDGWIRSGSYCHIIVLKLLCTALFDPVILGPDRSFENFSWNGSITTNSSSKSFRGRHYATVYGSTKSPEPSSTFRCPLYLQLLSLIPDYLRLMSLSFCRPWDIQKNVACCVALAALIIPTSLHVLASSDDSWLLSKLTLSKCDSDWWLISRPLGDFEISYDMFLLFSVISNCLTIETIARGSWRKNESASLGFRFYSWRD